MNTCLRKSFVFVLGAVLTAASPLLAASDYGERGYAAKSSGNVCKQTAKKMQLSCFNEVREEYFAEKAKCYNLVENDLELRGDCLREVKQTRKEDQESCEDQREARANLCDILPDRERNGYGPEAFLTPADFVAVPDGSNPYFSLQPGHTYVASVEGGFDDDDMPVVETVVVTVTDKIRTVLQDDDVMGSGVACRQVVDIVLVEGEPVEVTDDYYAQATNGDVHYCGEVARNFEAGFLVDLDGSFLAGLDRAKSGVLIRANPMTGEVHRQEWLPGEAEDAIRYLHGADDTTDFVSVEEGGENAAFACSDMMYDGCVKTEEFIPPEPDDGEYKYFIAGVGFVLGVALEEGVPTGEREQLVCTGDDMLTVLNDPACGLDAAERDALCELSSAFCP